MAAIDEIFDASVAHSVFLQRYSKRSIRDTLALLRRVEVQVVERLGRSDITAFSYARQEALLAAIRKIIKRGYFDIGEALTKNMRDLAVYEADWQAGVISKATPLKLDLSAPSSAQIHAAVRARPFQGRIMREWLRDAEAGAAARLRDAIKMGIVEGRTTEQIVRSIKGTARLKFKDGILAISRRNAATMVRTAINHTSNVAKEALYKENGDVIKGVQWVSTLDSKTSPVCRSRDGKIYAVGKGPRPPAHPNCRSTTIPVLKSWKEMGINLKEAPVGTRASMNGQVAGDMTYGAWLKKQGIEMQNDILGVKKGQLYRNGGLSMDRFVDPTGREYTLDQLRVRESEAWGRTFS